MFKRFLALVLFAMLAGCGDDDGSGTPAAPSAPGPQPGTVGWSQLAFISDCVPDDGCDFDGTMTLKVDGSYSTTATPPESGQLTPTEKAEINSVIDRIAASDLSREVCEAGVSIPELKAASFTLTYLDGRSVKFFDFSQDRGRCVRGDPALIEELSEALESVGD